MERRDIDPRDEDEEEEGQIGREGALVAGVGGTSSRITRAAIATFHGAARTALFTLAMAACAVGLMTAIAALGALLL